MSDENFDEGESYHVDKVNYEDDVFGFEIEEEVDEWGQPFKPHIETAHSERDEVKKISEDGQESFEHYIEEKDSKGERCHRVIDTSLRKLLTIQKIKKGRHKEMKNIDQFFKTETQNFLSMLAQLNVLSKSSQSEVKDFKEESSVMHSFKKLMKNEDIKEKTKSYYSSTVLIKQILTSERLKFGRKMEILKHIKSFEKNLELKN